MKAVYFGVLHSFILPQNVVAKKENKKTELN